MKCLFKSFVKFEMLYLSFVLSSCKNSIYSKSIPLRGRCFASNLWLDSFLNSVFQRVIFNFDEVQSIKFFMIHAFLLLSYLKKYLTNPSPGRFSLKSFIVLDVLHMV